MLAPPQEFTPISRPSPSGVCPDEQRVSPLAASALHSLMASSSLAPYPTVAPASPSPAANKNTLNGSWSLPAEGMAPRHKRRSEATPSTSSPGFEGDGRSTVPGGQWPQLQHDRASAPSLVSYLMPQSPFEAAHATPFAAASTQRFNQGGAVSPSPSGTAGGDTFGAPLNVPDDGFTMPPPPRLSSSGAPPPPRRVHSQALALPEIVPASLQGICEEDSDDFGPGNNLWALVSCTAFIWTHIIQHELYGMSAVP